MNKKVSKREFILLAILILICVYYFLVHLPVTNEMNQLAAEQTDVETQIDEATNRLLVKNSMQKEIDAVYAESNGNPDILPEYNNANQVMVELNSILADCESYNITFDDEQYEDHVVRRTIKLEFFTTDYADAKMIVQAIHRSSLQYLIQDLSINDKTLEDADGQVNTNIVMTCFEYSSEDLTKATETTDAP